MQIVTGYAHSSTTNPPLACSDENIEYLTQKVLDELNLTANHVVNIQMDGPWGGGEWGVRVFCRKE